MSRFCAECGVEESADTPIFNNLCLKCLSESCSLFEVRRGIVVHICRKCGSVRSGNKWVKADNVMEVHNLIGNASARSIKPALGVKIVDTILKTLETYSPVLEVEVKALIGNNPISKTLRVSVEWIRDICPLCLKRYSGSYEAVVQVRPFNYDDEVREFKNTLMHIFQDSILEIEDLEKGYDIKVFSIRAAHQIIDEIRRRWIVKISKSYGEQYRSREGRRRGRQYISTRIINLKPGNRLVIKNKAYIVDSVINNTVVLSNGLGKGKTLEIRELEKLL